MTIGARNAGFDSFVVPQANASEAALVDGVTVYGIGSLHEAVAIALGHGENSNARAAQLDSARRRVRTAILAKFASRPPDE